MISFTKGNLLDTDVEALVNTVNEVGVMGKGIALMFKEAYPKNFKEYAKACKKGEVEVGRVNSLESPSKGAGRPQLHWSLTSSTFTQECRCRFDSV